MTLFSAYFTLARAVQSEVVVLSVVVSYSLVEWNNDEMNKKTKRKSTQKRSTELNGCSFWYTYIFLCLFSRYFKSLTKNATYKRANLKNCVKWEMYVCMNVFVFVA